MSSLRTFSIGTTMKILPSVAIFLLAFPVLAQNDSSNYVFLLASGFLCDPGDSSTCPARAKANQGDSYELSGAGTFNAQNRSATAGFEPYFATALGAVWSAAWGRAPV